MISQRKYIGILISFILLSFPACQDEYDKGGQEGKLILNVSIKGKTDEVKSKSSTNPEENCEVKISNEDGDIYIYNSLSQIPDEIWLVSGNYSVSAVAGDSVLAGFDTPYYKGYQDFTISSGTVSETVLDARIANTLVTVNFTDELKVNFADYRVVAYNVQNTGELTFTALNEGEAGYYMMPETVKDIYWTFSGTTVDGETLEQSNVLQNVKACTNYIMTIHFDPTYSDGGGIVAGIEVDESFSNTEDDTETIIMPPSISGNQFDINQTVARILGTADDLSIWINGSSKLKTVRFTANEKTRQAFGLPTSEFDFIQMSEDVKNEFSTRYKIDCVDNEGEDGVWRMLITFSGDLLEFLDVDTYAFNIHVEDANGLKKERSLQIEITNAYVRTEDIGSKGGAWATKAYLKGTILNQNIDEYYFQFRKEGESDYVDIKSNIKRYGNTFTVEVNGLESDQSYQFRAVGDDYFADEFIFKTEVRKQLPNSSFEEWSQPNKPWLIYEGDKSNMFWDSGNHGSNSSSFLNVNLTTPSEENVIHGDFSAQLSSKYVNFMGMGRFAAGNLFAGEYKKTIQASGTDFATAGGEIDFGREFTSRPTKLKGWYRYTGGTIDYVQPDPKIPIPDELIADGAVNGKPDKANIFIALTDADSPYTIINTSALNNVPRFFDKNDDSVIAYGQWEQQDSTDEMKEFIIELEYKSLERKPKYIIVVCSASKYGDYFTGSTSSTLWLDDFELIYE